MNKSDLVKNMWKYAASIPADLKEPILIYCAKRDISVGQFIREAVKEKIKK